MTATAIDSYSYAGISECERRPYLLQMLVDPLGEGLLLDGVALI